jgi:hypothetical protein
MKLPTLVFDPAILAVPAASDEESPQERVRCLKQLINWAKIAADHGQDWFIRAVPKRTLELLRSAQCWAPELDTEKLRPIALSGSKHTVASPHDIRTAVLAIYQNSKMLEDLPGFCEFSGRKPACVPPNPAKHQSKTFQEVIERALGVIACHTAIDPTIEDLFCVAFRYEPLKKIIDVRPDGVLRTSGSKLRCGRANIQIAMDWDGFLKLLKPEKMFQAALTLGDANSANKAAKMATSLEISKTLNDLGTKDIPNLEPAKLFKMGSKFIKSVKGAMRGAGASLAERVVTSYASIMFQVRLDRN